MDYWSIIIILSVYEAQYVISKTMYRNKKMFILKNLGTKGTELYAYLSFFFKLKSLNVMLKYKLIFFVFLLLLY